VKLAEANAGLGAVNHETEFLASFSFSSKIELLDHESERIDLG
jgi:hypothetical protein